LVILGRDELPRLSGGQGTYELAVLQVNGTVGEFGHKRIVSHKDDRLAVSCGEQAGDDG
jgi:hypothetical protein